MRNVIVIGASAGGIPAIAKFLSGIEITVDAAILVVVHLSKNSNSQIIANRFQKDTKMHCVVAAEGMKIQSGFL